MSDIIGEIIKTAASIGVSCIPTLVVCYINNKHENERLKISLESAQRTNQKNINIQYIAEKRMDRICEVRDTLVEYISIAQGCASKIVEKSEISEKDSRDLNVCLAKLRLQFNSDEEYEKRILDLLNKIRENISLREEFKCKKFLDDIELLTKSAQLYLKSEKKRIENEIQSENGEKKDG